LKTSPEMQELCGRLNLRPSQVNAALRELADKGFIVSTTPDEPEPIFCQWRLTMLPCGGQPATHDYLKPEIVAKFAKVKAPRNGK
jgi:hypothetical protein